MQILQLFVRTCVTLVLGFSLLVQVAVGQMLTDEKRTELLAYIDGLGSDDAPGIGAGIVRDREIVFEHYIGLANLEHGIPISSDTRFNIASNAKQYTALMVPVTETEEGFLASIFGGNPVPLKLEDTNFYAYGDLAHVKLAFEQPEDTIKLSVYAGSSTHEMIKLPTLPDDDEWAKSVSGTFINPETDVQISLKYVGKNAFKISMADDLRDGKALGRDYLAMGSYRVEIVRDEFGDVAALSVDNSRNENIEFLPSGG